MNDELEVPDGQAAGKPVDAETIDEVIRDDAGDGAASEAPAAPRKRPRARLNPELFKAAASSMRAQVETPETATAGDVPLEPAGEGDAPAPVAGEAPPVDEPVEGPPPALIEQWERANARSLELEAREKELGALEERYTAIATGSPIEAMRALARLRLGDDATDSDIAEEVAWQVTQASIELAGAKVPTDSEAYKRRQQAREIRDLRLKVARSERAAQKQAEATAEEAKVSEAIANMGREFEPMAKQYPWAAAAADAAQRMWDLAWSEAQDAARRGQPYAVKPLAYYAQKVNDSVQKELLPTLTKYNHLLTPSKPHTTPPKSSPPTAPQGNPQRRSGPGTLTNKDASEEPTPPPAGLGELRGDERRRATLARMKAAAIAAADK